MTMEKKMNGVIVKHSTIIGWYVEAGNKLIYNGSKEDAEAFKKAIDECYRSVK